MAHHEMCFRGVLNLIRLINEITPYKAVKMVWKRKRAFHISLVT